jgi:heptosyltransferase-1
MKRILIVKVTSLGDIVETQPVVSDLRRAFPSAKIDWAADAAFADIIRWNPAVDRVLSAPLRKFKKARSWADLKDIAASIGELRAEKYDVVLDIHGVYKSAIIAFLARGRRRYGYKNRDLGELGAAFAYNKRFVITSTKLPTSICICRRLLRRSSFPKAHPSPCCSTLHQPMKRNGRSTDGPRRGVR